MTDRQTDGQPIRTTDDVVRVLVDTVNFGGNTEGAAVCREWADDYDADNAPPAPEPVAKSGTTVKK
jgi:hypothetical protein